MVNQHSKILFSRITLLAFLLSLLPQSVAFSRPPSHPHFSAQPVINQYLKNLETLEKSDPQLKATCLRIRQILQSELTINPALNHEGKTYVLVNYRRQTFALEYTLRNVPLSLQPEKWWQPVGMMLAASLVRRIKGGMEQDDNDQEEILTAIQLLVESAESGNKNNYFAALKELEQKIPRTPVLENPRPVLDKLFTALSMPIITMSDKRLLAGILCESVYLLSIRNQYSVKPLKIPEELKDGWLEQLKTAENQMDKEDVNGNGLEYALDVLKNGIGLLQITKSTTDQVKGKAKEIAKEHLDKMKTAVIGLLFLNTTKTAEWADSIVSDIAYGILTATYRKFKAWKSNKLYKKLLSVKALEWNLSVNGNNHLKTIDDIAGVLDHEKMKKVKQGDWQVYYAGLEALERAVWKSTDQQVQEKAWNVIAGYAEFKEFHAKNNWRIRQKVAESLTLFMTHPNPRILNFSVGKWKEMESRETEKKVQQTLRSKNYAEIKTKLKQDWEKTKSDMEQMLEKQDESIDNLKQLLELEKENRDNNNNNSEQFRKNLAEQAETYKVMVSNYEALAEELGLVIEKLDVYQKKIEILQASVQTMDTKLGKVQTTVQSIHEKTEQILTEVAPIRKIETVATGIETLQANAQAMDNKTGQILGKVSDLQTGVQDIKEELQELKVVRMTQKIASNLPLILKTFIGRESLLQAIEQQLGETIGVLAQASGVGLGGVGKTTLALEYAHRSLDKQKYEFVWWIQAETRALINTSLLGLAEAMGVWRPGEKANEGIQRVLKRLSQHPQPWLLIYDNAEDPDHLRGFLPDRGNGHLLITSRSPNWKNAVRVKTLTREESIQLLEKLTEQKDEKGADAIAELLGDLPLALTQAGEYMKQTGISYAEYRKLFEEQRKQLWEDEQSPIQSPIPEDKKTVSTVWEISIKKVEVESPEARALMQFMAFLAPEDVPRELLLNFIKDRAAIISNNNNNNQTQTTNPQFLINRAIQILQKYSLINVGEKGITLHRLMQLVVRDIMTEDQQKETVRQALKLVKEGFTFNENDYFRNPLETLKQSEGYVSHAEIIAGYGERLEVGMEEVGHLYEKLGAYMNVKAQYEESLVHHKKALQTRMSALGENHPDVARSYNNIGNVYSSQGKYEDALKMYEQALGIWKKVFGENHPDVASSYNNIGTVYSSQGKYEDALKMYEQALGIWKQAFGENHPDVARSYNNIGSVYSSQGKYEDALKMYEQALGIKKKALGENHPDVARSYNNIGTVYKSQGKYEDALRMYEQALGIWKKVFGENHPDVAMSYNSIGTVYKSQGKYEDALRMYEQALGIWKKVFGENHPHTKMVQRNIQRAKDAQKRGCIIALRGDVTLKKTAVGHELWAGKYAMSHEPWALSFLKKSTSKEAQSPQHKVHGRLVPLIRMMEEAALAFGWQIKVIVYEFKSAHVWMIKPAAELLSLGVSELKESKAKGVIHITTTMVEILSALSPGIMERIVKEIVLHEYLESRGMSHQEALERADPILIQFINKLDDLSHRGVVRGVWQELEPGREELEIGRAIGEAVPRRRVITPWILAAYFPDSRALSVERERMEAAKLTALEQ